MEIRLYKYTGSPNVISKTLNAYKSIDGYMSNDLDIDNPTIRLTSYTLDYNYVYIPVLKRYYYINDVTIDPNGVYILNLSIDVLMTFKDEILNSTILVTATNPNDFNSSDYKTPIKLFDTISLTNPFTFDEKTIILIGLNSGVENP